MDRAVAQVQIVQAGQRLQESNLASQTGATLSLRFDPKQFVITSTNQVFNNLGTNDIPIISINDFKLKLKIPLSTKLHTLVYSLRSDVNFILHSHQLYASVAGLYGQAFAIENDEDRSLLGDAIFAVPYGRYSTTIRIQNIKNMLEEKAKIRVLFLAHNGVLFFTDDPDSAFLLAERLEVLAKDFLHKKIAERFLYGTNFFAPHLYSGKRLGSACILQDTTLKTVLCKVDIASGCIQFGNFYPAVEIHRAIYSTLPKMFYTIHSLKPYTVIASSVLSVSGELPAFIEDVAQIVGDSLVLVHFSENRIQQICDKIPLYFKNRSAILINKGGALCCGNSFAEAVAVADAIEKNAFAFLLAESVDDVEALDPFAAIALRKDYIKHSSK